jgi:hypothetical protein
MMVYYEPEGDMTTTTVTIPNVHLSLDDLIRAVRQLEPEARAQVAEALLEDDVDRRLAALIERLAKKEPPADVTMSDINAEIRSVRNRTHFGLHIGNV